MGDFEDYDRKSADYEATRRPVGRELIRAALSSVCPLGSSTLLDAGCGTGTFLEPIASELGLSVAVDRSGSMLACASQKADLTDHVPLCRGDVVDLPFASSSFDGALCLNVLHHLEHDPADAEFPRIAQALSELGRVLMPAGVLILLNTLPHQRPGGYWWMHLIPEAVAEYGRKFPSREQLVLMLRAVPFRSVEVIPISEPLQGKHYFNPRGPLDDAWRNADSTWAVVSERELSAAQQRIEAMARDGTLPAYVRENDRERTHVGQTSLIIARKSEGVRSDRL